MTRHGGAIRAHPRRRRRIHRVQHAWQGMRSLDRLALACFALGIGCVATRLLPGAEAAATIRRILPLLAFLAAVIVLAELTAEAEVFDTVAARMARLARGSHLALFLLCVAFAALTATFLNLDTTAL